MGFLDLLKANENKRLKDEVEKLEAMLTPEQQEYRSLSDHILKLKEEEKEYLQKIGELNKKIQLLNTDVKKKESQLIILEEEVLMQEFGLYTPLYDFVTSKEYKDELEKIRQQQKKMMKDKTAVSYFDEWIVDGSKAKGKKMTNENIKQILRTFNTECEVIIDKVKFNNFDTMERRIQKSFDTLNKLNSSNRVSIEPFFLKLKIKELHLAHEFQLKKQDEKEEQKRIREELREELKLKKELEDAKKHVLKDMKHFQNALESVRKQLENTELPDADRRELEEKYTTLENTVGTLEENIKDIDYRQNNQRAGYVYIISNIGAFGEHVYKIGMTRRLDPIERVNELGDASVPFNFDVHAMIFSEDAPSLENALHKAFENKKLNMINIRREFFNVTLEEIEEVVKLNYDKTVEFVKVAPAEQYRESLKMK